MNIRRWWYGAMASLLIISAVVPALAQESNYIVQPGDSIQRIAQNFGVSADALLIRNAIIDPNSIRSGDILIIPGDIITMPTQHIVGHGETLSDIAIRYQTTVEALRQTNDLAAGVAIFPGQVIKLPAAGGAIVTGGGGGSTTTVTTQTAGAANFARTHIVDRGETLRTIAEYYGTTWQALAAANNIANANSITAGTALVIPAAGTTIAPTPVPTVPAQTAPATRVYVVQRGDTLSGIAQNLGVTLESLRAYNNISANTYIFAGQVLTVPPTGGAVVNPPAPVAPVVSAPVLPRKTVNGYYQVQAGDNLFAIAASFGVNIYQIAQSNSMLNLNMIYSGQWLRIPGR